MAGEQVAQPLGVDLPAGQGGVGAAPAALVDRFQAQVRQRRDRVGAQQCIAELEQRVGTAGETGVQLGAEVWSRARGKVGIGMAAQPDRTGTDRQPELPKHPHRVKSQAKWPGSTMHEAAMPSFMEIPPPHALMICATSYPFPCCRDSFGHFANEAVVIVDGPSPIARAGATAVG